MTTTEPVLIETRRDAYGVTYQEHWMTTPPDTEQNYRITRDEWNQDHSVRRIFEWVKL